MSSWEEHVACVSDGRQEGVAFDKITFRIQKLCYGLNSAFVDPVSSKHSSATTSTLKETSGAAQCQNTDILPWVV